MDLIRNVSTVLIIRTQKFQKKTNNNVIIVRIVTVLCVSQKLKRNMLRKTSKGNAIMQSIKNASIVSMLRART